MHILRATLFGAFTLAFLPSCLPLPNSKKEPTKAELAKTAPTLPGLTVGEAQTCFPGFTFTAMGNEKADLHTGIQKLGESSATVTIVSYAPDAVADVSVSIHRPGHATGPLLDRLMTEYLPKLTAVPYDGAEPRAARAWLTECRLRMSLSGYNDETTLGNADYTLNVLRNRATLRVAANGRPATQTPAVPASPQPPEMQTTPIAAAPIAVPPQAASLPAATVPTAPVTYIASPPSNANASSEDAADQADQAARKAAREKSRALQKRLDQLLANADPLKTLDAIAAFRDELDAIAADGPDTPVGKQAGEESAALGLLWVTIHYRNRIDVDRKLEEIIDKFPASRAAREATALLAPSEPRPSGSAM